MKTGDTPLGAKVKAIDPQKLDKLPPRSYLDYITGNANRNKLRVRGKIGPLGKSLAKIHSGERLSPQELRTLVNALEFPHLPECQIEQSYDPTNPKHILGELVDHIENLNNRLEKIEASKPETKPASWLQRILVALRLIQIWESAGNCYSKITGRSKKTSNQTQTQ